ASIAAAARRRKPRRNGPGLAARLRSPDEPATVPAMTADEYAAARHTLPEAGRWTELVAGVVVRHDEPDDVHGNVVLNLSRTIGGMIAGPGEVGFTALFDTGVVTATGPDSVRFPAVSLFPLGDGAGLFDDVGSVVTARTPEVVIEVTSTPSRRRDFAARIEELHAAGVRAVWAVDPEERAVTTVAVDDPVTIYTGDESPADGLLRDFHASVDDLFATPAWWHGGPPASA
ncbi:MAG: Uma2 family endonuclease, partial [Planctomycetota bacterium]